MRCKSSKKNNGTGTSHRCSKDKNHKGEHKCSMCGARWSGRRNEAAHYKKSIVRIMCLVR